MNEYTPIYFDRQGQPIDLDTWSELFEQLEYQRVAETYVGPYRVSTVWLGLNHNFLGGPPLIFETMVFDHNGLAGEDSAIWRYTTESQAHAGHEAMVALVRAECGIYDHHGDGAADPPDAVVRGEEDDLRHPPEQS